MGCTVELSKVTKIFGNTVALDNVDLKVNEGEILALLGPNGSGKTTLLKILALIEKPTSGEIYFNGKRILDKDLGQMRLESTMVFQKTIVFSSSVYDNVAYGLKIRGMPRNKINDEVAEALRLVKLEGFEKKQATKLSGGEQQRMALARALVLSTRLLLLDEPTANLDPKNASVIEEAIMTSNRQRKTTIIMATHNMFQARSLPLRIALIADGRINEVGEPSEIFGRLSKTLVSFAGVENTFTGKARVTQDGTTLVDIGNGVEILTTEQRSGQVSVFISPEDIILSKNRFASSARNVLAGKIVEIKGRDSVVRLKVDVGKPFTVQITKRSFDEFGLNLNAEVLLLFKASSVQIL